MTDQTNERTQDSDSDSGRTSGEEFAREHDPDDHDIEAGEEFRQRGDWTADEAGGPQVLEADDGAQATAAGSAAAAPEGGSSDQEGPAAAHGSPERRRESDLEEIRDGGYGIGSAAPIKDGAFPLGHRIKAWQDTKTFVTPEQHGYGDAEPHVWFIDEQAAQNAGFRPAG